MAKRQSDPWLICPVCDGEGKTVNPNIDAHGLTAEDFREDPDFAEDYKSGFYDITCAACNGMRVVKQERLRQLEQAADDRALAAREDGDWESYRVARDYRYGG
jgi:hypothetical protein